MAINNYWFDLYKNEYCQFKQKQELLLDDQNFMDARERGEGFYKNYAYYQAIEPYESRLKEIEQELINEITNNVLDLQSVDQRRIYLSIIQSFLDLEYENYEFKRDNVYLPYREYEFHISIGGIQNHIRKLFQYAEGLTNYSVGLEHLKGDPGNKNQCINEAVRETIERYLGCFKGKWQRQRIMDQTSYERLYSLTLELIDKDACPKVSNPFPKLPVSHSFISKTFSLLHDELAYRKRTNEINSQWIDFLKSAFSQFKSVEKTTIRTKFRSFSKDYNSYKALITEY